MSQLDSLILWIRPVDVLVEAVRPVHDAFAPLATHRKRVPYHSPLWLAVKRHNLAQVVNQPGQVQPVQLGMFLAGSFGRLKSVHDVWQVQIRVRFVHQVVELFQRLANVGLKVIELEPVLVATCKYAERGFVLVNT